MCLRDFSMTGEVAGLQEPLTETINGVDCAMSAETPSHSSAKANLSRLLSDCLKGKASQPCASGLEIRIDEKNRFRPDISVASDNGVPSLVIEVTAPSTVGFDTGRKFLAYQRHGVKEYWIASPESGSIEQFELRNGVFILKAIHSKDAKFNSVAFEDLEVNVREIFE
jgi:Uma2 family endonuclease